MTRQVIVVAGATGNLGKQIVQALLQEGATVKALVRSNSNAGTVRQLEEMGASTVLTDMRSEQAIAYACDGASCVVSALAGLHDVIIDTQKILLNGAVTAGVPRFIPSDYSLDFTPFRHGENRNLDLRRQFHQYLDTKPISATSIFNGAFMDMLTNEIPMILFKKKWVLYWGNADHRMVFTTIKDTACFTAHAAMDPATPRYLRIAGDQVSPRGIQAIVTRLKGEKFRLIRTGGLGLLSVIIKIAQTVAPSKEDLYPAWQGMQYMRNMMDPRASLSQNDNDRYPMHWTTVEDLLQHYLESKAALE